MRFLTLLFFLIFIQAAKAGAPQVVEIASSRDYQGKAVRLGAELYRPEGDGSRPAVVLMHGCDGLKPSIRHALRGYAKFFIENGYVALILDSFGPRGNGGGWVCKSPDRLISARIYRQQDALDALKFLRSLPFVDADHVFQMGQSNGGSVAIRLAQMDAPAFRASTAYYPGCGSFNRLGSKAELTAPLLVLAGAADDWTPPADCLSIRASGAEYRVEVYPGAVHSFDLEIERQEYLGHQVGYDRDAAIDSRERMLGFFYTHMSELMKARVSAPVFDEKSPVVFLHGDEIRRLMPSGKLQGINGYGNPYTIVYSADGAISGVAGKADEYRDSGKWWVEGDRFCRQYRVWFDGRAACFGVSLDGDAIGFYDAGGRLVSSGSFSR